MIGENNKNIKLLIIFCFISFFNPGYAQTLGVGAVSCKQVYMEGPRRK